MMQAFGIMTDTLTDDAGCSKEGYLFEMSFTTTVVGSSPPA
jgi:hypothetical protein